jgi:hypothetical protein
MQVAGLASRANKSPVVQQKFEEHVATFPGLSSSAHPSLATRMPTRWNTELNCLRSHVHKRPAVKLLTSDRDLSLKKYQLTEPQWDLAIQLVDELKVCPCTQLVPNLGTDCRAGLCQGFRAIDPHFFEDKSSPHSPGHSGPTKAP